MRLLEKIRYLKQEVVKSSEIWNLCNNKEFELNRKAGDLIRYTHSIEKGLSIAETRLGFGHEKQKIILDLIEALKCSDDSFHNEAVLMAIAALREYVNFHLVRNYSDEMVVLLQEYLSTWKSDSNLTEYGGIISVNKEKMNIDILAVENFFLTRHSIRDFDDSEVDKDILIKSIRLAQCAPSACNRQGVRVYVMNHNKAAIFKNWLTGIGGFEETIKEFILITGKHSVYWANEKNQYIVSASMYAAYLSLTLHMYGLGACVVQRDVTYNERWELVRNKLGIPKDEQAICILGVGNLKDEFDVPVSHRLKEDVFIRKL